jgi:hypothetical protein
VAACNLEGRENMAKLFLRAVAAWAFICGAYALIFNAVPDLAAHYQDSFKMGEILILFASVAFWLFIFCVVTQATVMILGKLRNRATHSLIFGLLEFSLILILYSVMVLVIFFATGTFLSHFFLYSPLIYSSLEFVSGGPLYLIVGMMIFWAWGGPNANDVFFALLSWLAIILCAFAYLYIAFIKHYERSKAALAERDE